MRKVIQQAVDTLDGQMSTPQDWLPTRWAGSGERLYDGIDTTEFDLMDVKRLDNGIVGLTYVPATP